MKKIKPDVSKQIKELYANICGITVNQMEENERTAKKSRKYNNLSPAKWPEFELLWDLSKENYIKTLDGFNSQQFEKNYPCGFFLGNVSFLELNNKLATHCVRNKEKIWESGSLDKLAKVILYWKEKRKMTPILIGFYKNDLIIGGGFHRHAVCLIKNPDVIPILVIPSEKEKIEKILTSIKWLH